MIRRPPPPFSNAFALFFRLALRLGPPSSFNALPRTPPGDAPRYPTLLRALPSPALLCGVAPPLRAEQPQVPSDHPLLLHAGRLPRRRKKKHPPGTCSERMPLEICRSPPTAQGLRACTKHAGSACASFPASQRCAFAFSHSRFTTFCGFPSLKRRMFSSVMEMMLRRAPSVIQAM